MVYSNICSQSLFISFQCLVVCIVKCYITNYSFHYFYCTCYISIVYSYIIVSLFISIKYFVICIDKCTITIALSLFLLHMLYFFCICLYLFSIFVLFYSIFGHLNSSLPFYCCIFIISIVISYIFALILVLLPEQSDLFCTNGTALPRSFSRNKLI